MTILAVASSLANLKPAIRLKKRKQLFYLGGHDGASVRW